MKIYFNQELVEMFIDFFEGAGYKDFVEILPKRGKISFLHDYYHYHIMPNKHYTLEYHNMYCHLSTVNN
jgi:hypothetical protein